MDLRRAFDSVDREALWHKLFNLGISNKMMRIIMSKYSSCEFRVRMGDGRLTEPIASRSGVMQGDQLSALLFILFLNDLEDHLKPLSNRYAPTFDGVTDVGSIWFADDICLLATSEIGARRMLESVNDFCEKWNLTINPSKTKMIEFRRKRKKAKGGIMRLKGNVIESVEAVQYLGLTFDKTGDWKMHINPVSYTHLTLPTKA